MRKVLLVKLASLGDVLATSPFPMLIKKHHTNLSLHHLVMEHCRVVTEHNPWLDKQIVIEFMPSGNRWVDLARAAKLVFRLRAEKYDTAFVFHRNLFFQVVCWLGGIREIYGFSSRLNPFYKKHMTYRFDVNRTEQECDLLRMGGLDIPNVESLEFHPAASELSDEIAQKLPDQFIACNPGGGNPHAPADNRMWPIEKYAALINASSLPFVILGHGAADAERVNELTKMVDSARMVSLVNNTSFSDTALVLQRATLYVGNDSSLMFLAAAMGISTVGLYGPTQSVAANPVGKKQYAIIGNAECAPCYNPYDGVSGKMYACTNNICMQDIDVEVVLNRINTLIKECGAENK
ncbi:glycosyltransferase family 9 protein [Crenobacter cavernae]|uniref:Glycosyltransferase family 9 protein n=1 Tax=Crenobacter cavernae TaxID=2290923 RepID=A0A345Y532_9NEIS|nr:glycosyltransferase family 9 protein [Crenobacter cavernae]AXK39034.1 glycosyltransferase family 9 protein [Crenobacter cavernae]